MERSKNMPTGTAKKAKATGYKTPTYPKQNVPSENRGNATTKAQPNYRGTGKM